MDEPTKKCITCGAVKPVSKFTTTVDKKGNSHTYRSCTKCRVILNSKTPTKKKVDEFVKRSMYGLGPNDY